MVARDMPSAPIKWSGGIVSPIRALRITRSFGRTMPLSAASAMAQAGVSPPVKARSITVTASVA